MSKVEIRDVGDFKDNLHCDDYSYKNGPFFRLVRFEINREKDFLLEFGDGEGTKCLMIWVDRIFGVVKEIDCFVYNSLFEAKLTFPEVEINKNSGVACFSKGYRDDGSEKSSKFQMSINTEELDIVLDPQNTPDETMELYVEDRVEYGIGYDDTVQYIRIKDLTPEEYAILKKYKTDRPIEDFAPIAYL